MKSPASLLSEINERIKPDENGLAASEKLTKIINVVEKEEGSIADLSDDDKKFTLDLVKKAINEMDLDAGDDSVYEPEGEDEPEESVDLSDIRADYGIEELPEEEIQEGGDCYDCDGKDADCKSCGGTGYVQFDDDPQEPSQEEIDKHEAAYKKYIGKHKKDKKDESVEISEISPDTDQMVADIEANTPKKGPTAQQRAIAQDLTGKQVGTVDTEIDRLKGSTNPAIKSLLQYKKALDILASQDSNIKQQVASIIDKMNANPGQDSDSDYRADRMANVHPEIDDSIDYDLQERSDGDDEPSISNMSDEDLMDYVGQKEEDLVDDIQQHIAPVHLNKENFEEMFEKYREEVLEPAAHDVSQDHAVDNMDYDVDAEESIEDTSNKALEAAMEELKKLAGLEEDEKTEPCPKCGKQRIILKACASCGCS